MMFLVLSPFLVCLVLVLGRAGGSCEKPLRDWLGDEMDCYHENTPWIQQAAKVPIGTPMRARRTLPPGFIIANSTIPGAGLGVFSTMFIPRYTWLAEYEGDIVISGCDTGDYAWLVWRGDHVYFRVDGEEEDRSNWLRYVNCSRKKKEENVLMLQCFDKPFYITRRDIRPGEELLIFYGKGYASDLGIDMSTYTSGT